MDPLGHHEEDSLKELYCILLCRTSQKCSLMVELYQKESLSEIGQFDDQNVWHMLLGHFELTCVSHPSSYFQAQWLCSLWSTTWPSIRRKCIHCVSPEEKLQNTAAGPNCLIIANKSFLAFQNMVVNLLMLSRTGILHQDESSAQLLLLILIVLHLKICYSLCTSLVQLRITYFFPSHLQPTQPFFQFPSRRMHKFSYHTTAQK